MESAITILYLQDKQKSSLCQIFSIMHKSVSDFSYRMLQEMKRHNYVTPTNYLELVSGYKRYVNMLQWAVLFIIASIAVPNLFLCPQRNFGGHIVIALSVRLSVRQFPLLVRCISPIFFEVGISNLVCGCILGWRSVAYHFRVTVTLTSDLGFRIIMSGAYLLYFLR